jgi:TonB family protein
MKHLAFMSLVLLLAFGIVQLSAEAQRRRRPHPRTQMAKNSDIREIDFGTPAERDKIIAECEVPDRPRPESSIEEPVLCGRGISFPKPSYPEEAKAEKVSGTVSVDVVIDEKGRVIWAKATSGHSLLQEASRKAGCRARYSPMRLSGQVVKASSTINYNFVGQ